VHDGKVFIVFRLPRDKDHLSGIIQLAGFQLDLEGTGELLTIPDDQLDSPIDLFAAAALVSVGGSIETFYGHVVAFYSAATPAVLTGASAVFGLCAGCVLMVRERQLAVKSLEEEAKIHAGLQHQPQPPH
jgi:hypothetical protein